ncbi:hypothetical protein KDL29_01725 [bacterium]|nr:hypothetical protein [bacterium]
MERQGSDKRTVRTSWWAAGLLCLIAILSSVVPARAADTVESVAVLLRFEGGFVGNETMSRLDEALTATAQVAIMEQLGGDLDYILRNSGEVSGILSDVVDSALESRGFDLVELSLDPGVRTTVNLTLRIAEQRVSAFTVDFHVMGNVPRINDSLGDDEQRVVNRLYETLASTPYDDKSWLTSLVHDTVADELSRMPAYADFEHSIVTEPGETTRVVVSFEPRPDALLVSDFSISIRSLTLTNLQLRPARDSLAYYLQSFVDLPVSFVSNKLSHYQQGAMSYLNNNCSLVAQCPDSTLSLRVNTCTIEAWINLDSTRFLYDAQIRLDLWEHSEYDIHGRLSAGGGRFIGGRWAAYFHADYHPGLERVNPMIGLARQLGPQTLLSAGYDLQAESMRLRGEHHLRRDVYFSADIFTEDDWDYLSELAVHYRLHDIYELQLVSTMDGEVFAAIAADL